LEPASFSDLGSPGNAIELRSHALRKHERRMQLAVSGLAALNDEVMEQEKKCRGRGSKFLASPCAASGLPTSIFPFLYARHRCQCKIALSLLSMESQRMANDRPKLCGPGKEGASAYLL